MLSLDLFDSKYERGLHEGAVDDLERYRIDTLNDRMQELLNRAKEPRYKNDPEALAGLKRQYQKIKDERDSYYKIRETQQPRRDPAKGLLKGKDLVTPQQRVAGAMPPKTGMVGAVKDVAGGLKRWLKGEPDQGPTYEQQEPGTPGASPRAYGVANFQRLVKANMGAYGKMTLEFANPADNIALDKRGIDLISDYYDGLENDSLKNHFIYRVLPSADETEKVLKKLGWTRQVQQELPGIPTQGELPLSEKKKSEAGDNLQAGDVKVARELQKLRAQYPAARSDVEAVARAEIDSTERNKQQLSAIRGANEKQDALLKKLVALDQEQGQEITSLDSELDRVQATNDKLQQTIQAMTGVKKSGQPKADTAGGAINLIPGAPADIKNVTPEPEEKPAAAEPAPSPAIGAMARTIAGLPSTAPDTSKKADVDTAPVDQDDVVKKFPSLGGTRPKAAANVDDFKLVGEHGGGIGPRQHWQSLMREGRIKQALDDYKTTSDTEFYKKFGITKREFYDTVVRQKSSKPKYKAPAACPQCGKQHESCVCESDEQLLEGIRDTASATAVIACLLTGGSLSGCATAPQQTTSQQVLKTGADLGRTVQTAKKITRAGVEAEVNQEIRNLSRGIGGQPAELNNSNILRVWRKLQGRPAVPPEPQAPEYGPAEPVRRPQNEAKEIRTRDEFLDERARLLRLLGIESNPANKQIIRATIRQLEGQAEQQGWLTLQQRLVKEDTAALAAEDAILKRIFVRHRDLMMEYGPDKIAQAAESVAYNVGDIAHITDEQINEWVGQVEYILGARP